MVDCLVDGVIGIQRIKPRHPHPTHNLPPPTHTPITNHLPSLSPHTTNNLPPPTHTPITNHLPPLPPHHDQRLYGEALVTAPSSSFTADLATLCALAPQALALHYVPVMDLWATLPSKTEGKRCGWIIMSLCWTCGPRCRPRHRVSGVDGLGYVCMSLLWTCGRCRRLWHFPRQRVSGGGSGVDG